MNDKITIEEVSPRFVAMTVMQRLLFLTTYAHEITIQARAAFADKDFESARLCNGTLHRLAGYSGSLIRNPTSVGESSFILMLVDDARQKGWHDILLRSMKLTR